MPEQVVNPGEFDAKARLAAIVESSDDAIISKTLEGIITSWNTAAQRMFGYSAAEAIGHPISIIIPPERGVEEPAILERIRRGERVDHYETVRVRKDGQFIDVSVTISPVKDLQGKIVGASKIARDISERKRAEQRVYHERERLQVTLSSIGDAVIVTDPAGRVQFLNPAAEELTSWKQREAEGQPLEAVFSIVNEQTRRRIENPVAKAIREVWSWAWPIIPCSSRATALNARSTTAPLPFATERAISRGWCWFFVMSPVCARRKTFAPGWQLLSNRLMTPLSGRI